MAQLVIEWLSLLCGKLVIEQLLLLCGKLVIELSLLCGKPGSRAVWKDGDRTVVIAVWKAGDIEQLSLLCGKLVIEQLTLPCEKLK